MAGRDSLGLPPPYPKSSPKELACSWGAALWPVLSPSWGFFLTFGGENRCRGGGLEGVSPSKHFCSLSGVGRGAYLFRASHPQLATAAPFPPLRLVHSGCRSPCLGSELSFATRSGSRQGIEMHVFRVETHRDLSTWTRTLVQGCHAAAELVKEVSVGMAWLPSLRTVAPPLLNPWRKPRGSGRDYAHQLQCWRPWQQE